MTRPTRTAEPGIEHLTLRVAAGAVFVMFLWAVCFPLIKVGLVIGVVLFAEQVHGIETAGIALSLLGIYWVSRPVKTRRQNQRDSSIHIK